MQELANALTNTIEKYQPETNRDDSELLTAAKNWASYCLENMYGDLLQRGLAISAAMAHFDVGFLHPEKLKD